MTPEQYQRVSDLFLQASEMNAAQQGTFLDSACGDDPEVRRKVEQMLQAHHKDDSILNKPVAELKIRCPHCHNPLKVVDDPLIERTCPSCGSNFSLLGQDATMSFSDSGKRAISHFELLENLGSGAFGTVWKARDTKLDRIVALKVPRKSQLSDEEIEKFFREARAAAQIRHANIVSVHEVGRENDTIYIVSDFIEGLNLDDWLSDQRMTARESASLCVQLAQALHHAHEAGVVHRDLKPANIMLSFPSDNDDSRLTPHIMDFGLARREAGEITMTVEGRILGTPAYMSPEQARGQGHIADRRADIYSLGVILFKLLTSDLPFRGNMRMLLHHVIHDDAPSPRRLNNAIPRDLETICLKCLQKEPSRRYATAKDLADDLQRYLDGKPILARPVSNLEKTGKWIRRNPVVSSLIAAVFLVLVLGTSISIWQAVRATVAEVDAKEKERSATKQQLIAEQKTKEAQLEKQKAESEAKQRKQAEEEVKKELKTTQHSLFNAQLQRVAAIYQRDPMYGAQLLNDRDIFPMAMRDTAWRWYSDQCRRKLKTLFVNGTGGFGSDGKTIALLDRKGSGGIWNLATGDIAQSFKGTNHPQNAIAYSSDGKLLAVLFCESNGKNLGLTIRIWDASAKKEIITFQDLIQSAWLNGSSLNFSPDGKTLAWLGWKNNGRGKKHYLKIWDLKTGREKLAIGNPEGVVLAMAFSPEGKYLATAGGNFDNQKQKYTSGMIQIWNLIDGKEVGRLENDLYEVTSLAFSPDGKELAAGSYQITSLNDGNEIPTGEIMLWNIESKQKRLTLKGHRSSVTALSFHPGKQYLVSASDDQTMIQWDVHSAQQITTLTGHNGPIGNVFICSKGEMMVSEGGGKLVLWKFVSNPESFSLKGHGSAVQSVKYSPDGAMLASSGWDSLIKLWDVATGTELKTLTGHNGIVTNIAFAPNGKILASGCNADKSVKLWNVDSGKEEQNILVHKSDVHSVNFSPDGSLFASGSTILHLWDVKQKREARVLKGHRDLIASIAFSPEGDTLATGSWDDTVKLWNVSSGNEILEINADSGNVNCVAFSSDGTFLATAHDKNVVKIWDAKTGKEIKTLKGHSSQVSAVSFSPNGKTLISASWDLTIRLWDVHTGQEQAIIRGHNHPINAVAIHPHGRSIASGGFDSTVKLWSTPHP